MIAFDNYTRFFTSTSSECGVTHYQLVRLTSDGTYADANVDYMKMDEDMNIVISTYTPISKRSIYLKAYNKIS